MMENKTKIDLKNKSIFILRRFFGYSHSTSDNLWSLQWCHFYAPFLPAVYGKYKERGGRPVFHPADSEILTLHGQAQFLDVRG